MSDMTPQNKDSSQSNDILENLDILSPNIPTTDTNNNSEGVLPWEEDTLKGESFVSAPQILGKIIDINLNSLEDIMERLQENEYDFVTLEPEESDVKISFKKDDIDRNIVYIRYPVYTSILLKVKQTAGLLIENIQDTQEGKGKYILEKKNFSLSVKTVPGPNGERIWIKAKEDASNIGEKKTKKTPLSTIFAFLWAILFVCLVLGGTFITFVVLNTNDVNDVRFFSQLWINLKDINDFLSSIVTLIFSILLFLFTIVLSVSLFKFFITKKVLRKKKIIYGLFSIFLLLCTFTTGVLWMAVEARIQTFPNWGEWDLQIYDNNLKLSGSFQEDEILIEETQNIIWPISLLFDLTNFETNQRNKGLTIKKYIWDINGQTTETFIPTLIQDFNEKWNYTLKIKVLLSDINNQEIEESINNIPPIAINNIINIEETPTNNWGLRVWFDANDLKNLWEIAWYFQQPVTPQTPEPEYAQWTKMYDGYDFIARQIFYETMYVWVDIIDKNAENPQIDKILIINPNSNSEISGEIVDIPSLSDELSVEFFVQNPKTSFGNGFIESYVWNIDWRTYTFSENQGEEIDTSGKVEHVFWNYWSHKISVTLTDSKGMSKTLTKDIVLQKRVEIQNTLLIFDKDDEDFKDFRYEKRRNEYFIDNLGIPATLKFDARNIQPANPLYSLQEVLWDIKEDGNIDGKEKRFVYEVPVEWNHLIAVTYNFAHRKDATDIISLKEYIYIEGVKKDAILSLKMIYDTNYAPVNVRFDASESYIKNDNIIKFSYDYGDGISEERDAINPGHRYTQAWDYTITLTVTGKTGKTYSIQKKLILLPPPQAVQIATSMKKAPIGQGIDFSSSESSGQIIEYFWNFGDGNTSTQANPTHSYKKAGVYKVVLKVNFDNKNSISDEVEIEIQ